MTGGGSSTFPASLSCETRVREFVVVCPEGGRNATVQVAAVDATTTLTAWSFDAAGNINEQVHSLPVSYTFTVGNTEPMPATVLPVTTHGGAQVVEVETMAGVPQGTTCQGGLAEDADVFERGSVLQFTNIGDYATTATAAIDTSKSFSISGWFCPSTPTAAGTKTLAAQLNGAGSPGGALRITGSGSAALTAWSGPNQAGPSTVNASDVMTANTWQFISTVYDKINRQLRLTVTADGTTKQWTVATSGPANLPTGGTDQVVLGALNAAGMDQFIGQIHQPVMTNHVLTGQQFTFAQYQFNGQTGVLR